MLARTQTYFRLNLGFDTDFSLVSVTVLKNVALIPTIAWYQFLHRDRCSDTIRGYSGIAAPLTNLLKKNQTWDWTEECQRAFDRLKHAVSEEPVMVLADHTKPFEVHTDASDFAIGGVLMQDGHPIAFESRKLNGTERRYTVQEKEMTAIVHCLRTWRHYLLGSKFTVMTDNVATSYFQT